MDRKQEILQVAYDLFETQGFDQTSTNDIIEKIGIARGTLYHHFKSKEDILDTIIQRISEQKFSKAQAIAENQELSIQERIIGVVASMNKESQSEPFMSYLHQPQNALMHEKIHAEIFKQLPKIFEIIINDAIKQGLMSCESPYLACELLVIYSTIAFDDKLMVATSIGPDQRIEFLANHLCLLFGCKPGFFDFLLKGA